jgi:hypothetical protein
MLILGEYGTELRGKALLIESKVWTMPSGENVFYCQKVYFGVRLAWAQ